MFIGDNDGVHRDNENGIVGHMDDDVHSRQCHNMPKIITMTRLW